MMCLSLTARRRAQIGLAMVALLLPGACSGTKNPYEPPPHLQFDRTSPEAIAVIGLRSAEQVSSLVGIPIHNRIRLFWTRVQQHAPATQQPVTFEVGTKMMPFGLPGSTAPQDMDWHIVRLPPGTYMMSKIVSWNDRARFTTHSDSMQNRPFFTVKAGEVRYIGDLHIDAKSFPAKILKLTRDDAMAGKSLAAYPRIQAPLQFRPPAYIPAGTTAAVFMQISEN